ncbi:MAG: 3'-5' exonuclease [Candidatus Delongbacteria bacterium]
MLHHFMIDIETWDTAPTAVIRAIAIVGFNLNGTLNEMTLVDCRRTVDEQIQAGRTTSAETVDWWAKQSFGLGDLLVDTRHHATDTGIYQTEIVEPRCLADVVRNVEDGLMAEDGEIRVWSRGHFDITILENLLQAQGDPVPWRYSQVRDVRTLDEIIPPDMAQWEHHPLSDCLAQIRQVCMAMRMAKAAASEAFNTH